MKKSPSRSSRGRMLGRVVVLSLAVSGVACTTTPPLCTPGASVACACASGQMGAQLCARDGTLGECACGEPDSGLTADAAVVADAGDASQADGGEIDAASIDASTDGDIDARMDGGVAQDAFTDAPADARTDAGRFEPTYVWARRFGGSEEHLDRALTDTAGNIFLLGRFSGSIDFGGGALTAMTTEDTFVAMLNSTGAHVWARRFASSGHLGATDMAVDAGGRVYVIGSFTGTTDFGGGPLVSSGMYDGFAFSLDAAGAHQWSTRWGGTTATDSMQPFRVAVDAAGNTYTTGLIRGSVSVGTGTLTSVGGEDMLLFAVDAAGATRWAHSYGTTRADNGALITLDGLGNVVVGVAYDTSGGALDLGGGPLASADMWAPVIASFDTGGAHRWSRVVAHGMVSTDEFVDYAGSLVVTGRVTGSADFGAPVGMRASLGGDDALLLTLNDASGAPVGARLIGGSAADSSGPVLVDSEGMIVAGRYAVGVDFGAGPVIGSGPFIAAYTSSYAYRWLWTGDVRGVLDIAPLPSHRLLVAGVFDGAVDFGGGPLLSSGSGDLFLLALALP